MLSKRKKKFWKCNICDDIQYGLNPPKVCPTCKAVNSYIKIGWNEARQFMGF
ncbi:MAG: rubredoxin-like domain-containing protein [Nanoarchaeota archaeon]